MKIDYRTREDFIPVDIERLRPKDSYKRLFQNRTHSIDKLVSKFGKIPEEFLDFRKCPTCFSSEQLPELEKDHMQLVRCKACDLVYVSPAFNEEHYRQTYSSQDYQQIVRELGEESHLYRV